MGLSKQVRILSKRQERIIIIGRVAQGNFPIAPP